MGMHVPGIGLNSVYEQNSVPQLPAIRVQGKPSQPKMPAARLETQVNLMEFKLPELGEGVYEAELVSCAVQLGDVVESGQNLLEVLTDKA